MDLKNKNIFKHCKPSHAESTNDNVVQVGGFTVGTVTECVREKHRTRDAFWEGEKRLNP